MDQNFRIEKLKINPKKSMRQISLFLMHLKNQTMTQKENFIWKDIFPHIQL